MHFLRTTIPPPILAILFASTIYFRDEILLSLQSMHFFYVGILIEVI